MESTDVDDSLTIFQKSLKGFVKWEHAFFMDAGVTSVMLSNLQNLTIPGSKLNAYGTSCNCRLDDDHISALAKGLLSAKIQLQTLSLPNHNITDKGFDIICSDIADRHLLHLDLEGNSICGSGISGLSLDSGKSSLLTLNLSCNPLTIAAGMEIADSLRMNYKLSEINLSNCGFNLNIIVALATTLRQNASLEILRLDRPLTNTLTRQEEGIDHLSRLLDGPLSRISVLSLRYHCIEDHGARLIATSLRRNRSLTHLDLERNKIGPSGCEALASHLILEPFNGCSLRTLLLSYNVICDEGAKAMANVLVKNQILSHLSLKSNNINEAGLISLGESVKQNKSLKSLSIFGNCFTHDTGALFYDLNSIKPVTFTLDIAVYKVDGEYLTAEINESKEFE